MALLPNANNRNTAMLIFGISAFLPVWYYLIKIILNIVTLGFIRFHLLSFFQSLLAVSDIGPQLVPSSINHLLTLCNGTLWNFECTGILAHHYNIPVSFYPQWPHYASSLKSLQVSNFITHHLLRFMLLLITF